MRETKLSHDGLTLRQITVNTAVVGTGAAGYNAADRLWSLGQTDLLLLTEARMAGTSRNTGSDKQTYYKLTLAGGEPDSVREMAQTLFDAGCVDGDLALAEAALSAQSFLRLAELGVPFPRNRWGEYVGYKTDHDPRRRATSVGPYTSRLMTEKLERAVQEKNIPFLDHVQVIRILRDDKRVRGLLCLDTAAESPAQRFLLICCRNVIYATGGPAGIYASSAYPPSQFGASGLAFEAGVSGRNLTEWQYGMASLRPRWNVSGSYMQVLPRLISTAADGSDVREFLLDAFSSPEEMLSLLFLKGYQWPFDARKAAAGSSRIDLLVHRESLRGRRVFLDYRSNPAQGTFRFEGLAEEARKYLEKAGVCFGTPYERLCHMNRPAVDFYLDRGVDLGREPLEIAICAQHNNGGLAVDSWWQTELPGFFAVGEVAGSHGIYRPGGAALNAGQVGSLRAAQYIAAHCRGAADEEGFEALALSALRPLRELAERALRQPGSIRERIRAAAARMSLYGAAFRGTKELEETLAAVKEDLAELPALVSAADEGELAWVFRYRDQLLAQSVYLAAMLDYIASGGGSRGSALYTDPQGEKADPSLPELFRFTLDEGASSARIQEAVFRGGELRFTWRPVRPIPEDDDFFENVWRDFRETGNIY